MPSFLSVVFFLSVVIPLGCAAVAWATPATVAIESFQFSPAEVVVRPGEAVTFINRDAAPHTASPAPGVKFAGTGRLLSGESRTVVFDKKGSYPYFCEFHTTMTGKVVVR
jgi:plastocyanin